MQQEAMSGAFVQGLPTHSCTAGGIGAGRNIQNVVVTAGGTHRKARNECQGSCEKGLPVLEDAIAGFSAAAER